MRTTRTARLLGGVVATAGILVAGSGVAAADEPEPGPITLSPEQSRRICEERIPTLLARIDRIEERIAGDANTPGSTAWLQERLDRARSDGRDALADRLQRRLDRRPQVEERLATAQHRVETFRDEQCV